MNIQYVRPVYNIVQCGLLLLYVYIAAYTYVGVVMAITV